MDDTAPLGTIVFKWDVTRSLAASPATSPVNFPLPERVGEPDSNAMVSRRLGRCHHLQIDNCHQRSHIANIPKD